MNTTQAGIVQTNDKVALVEEMRSIAEALAKSALSTMLYAHELRLLKRKAYRDKEVFRGGALTEWGNDRCQALASAFGVTMRATANGANLVLLFNRPEWEAYVAANAPGMPGDLGATLTGTDRASMRLIPSMPFKSTMSADELAVHMPPFREHWNEVKTYLWLHS